MTQVTQVTSGHISPETRVCARACMRVKIAGDVTCVTSRHSPVIAATLFLIVPSKPEESEMTRKAMNFLAKQLRDAGELPRSLRQVKAELRKSGKILPPYDQEMDKLATDEKPDSEPLKKSRSYQRKADQPTAITPIEYGGLQEAYDHFNKELFGGTLPDVFITYQRRANSGGYFSPDRFSGRVDELGRHELALNPDGFIGKTDEWIDSVLTHEMGHVWQHAHGKPSARGYHNKEWAAKMKEIGLQASSTGMVGGKETGQRMMHYIIPGGAFQKSYQRLAATGWKLNLQSAPVSGPKGGKNSKTKFTCPECGQNAWGKPDLAVICKPCRIEMKSADATDEAVAAA
jgi:predicted SprT family Zn-dependent metalloprotease